MDLNQELLKAKEILDLKKRQKIVKESIDAIKPLIQSGFNDFISKIEEIKQSTDSVERKSEKVSSELEKLQTQLKKKDSELSLELENLKSELAKELLDNPKLKGKDGINGKNGKNGKDGKNGINGKDGKDGKDGIDGITTTVITIDNKSIDSINQEISKVRDQFKKADVKTYKEFEQLLEEEIKKLKALIPMGGVVRISGGGGASVWGAITGTLSDQTDLQGVLDNKMDIDGLNSNIDKLTFNTTPTIGTPTQGQLYWDETNHTASLTLNSSVNLQLGQEIQIYVRNNSGATITNGSVVYQTGVIGGHPSIAKAIATSESTTYPLAVATQDILNNDWGYCTTFGKVRDLNTNAYNENDELFLSSTVAGTFTATPPTSPNYVVKIGSVTVKNGGSGEILVNIHNPLSNNTTLSGNSQKLSATEYAIKTYIDNNSGGSDSGFSNIFLLMGA